MRQLEIYCIVIYMKTRYEPEVINIIQIMQKQNQQEHRNNDKTSQCTWVCKSSPVTMLPTVRKAGMSTDGEGWLLGTFKPPPYQWQGHTWLSKPQNWKSNISRNQRIETKVHLIPYNLNKPYNFKRMTSKIGNSQQELNKSTANTSFNHCLNFIVSAIRQVR